MSIQNKRLLIIARVWVLTNKPHPVSCRHPELLALVFMTYSTSVEIVSLCVHLIMSKRSRIDIWWWWATEGIDTTARDNRITLHLSTLRVPTWCGGPWLWLKALDHRPSVQMNDIVGGKYRIACVVWTLDAANQPMFLPFSIFFALPS